VAANCGGSEGQPSSTFRKSTDAPRSGPSGEIGAWLHLNQNWGPQNNISAAPTASAFVQSIVAEEIPEEPEEAVEAMVLFNFTATSEFELDVRGECFDM